MTPDELTDTAMTSWTLTFTGRYGVGNHDDTLPEATEGAVKPSEYADKASPGQGRARALPPRSWPSDFFSLGRKNRVSPYVDQA